MTETIVMLEEWLLQSSGSPTSQITGGGAVALAESTFAGHHEGRPCLMVPSATYGMRAALKALGVTPGSEVLIPALDWPSTRAAVESIGARAIAVPVEPATLTIDSKRLTRYRTSSTRAVVACHLHGVAADVPAIRQALGDDLPIVEDAAQAFGSRLDGRPIGVLGDVAVFSFGPEKALDVGEAGMVVARDRALGDAILCEVGHPVRQVLGGIEPPNLHGFSVRPHPLGAVCLVQRLRSWDPTARSLDHAQLGDELDRLDGIRVVGRDPRRASIAVAVPVAAETHTLAELGSYRISPSGARDLGGFTSIQEAIGTYLISRHPQKRADVSMTNRGDAHAY